MAPGNPERLDDAARKVLARPTSTSSRSRTRVSLLSCQRRMSQPDELALSRSAPSTTPESSPASDGAVIHIRNGRNLSLGLLTTCGRAPRSRVVERGQQVERTEPGELSLL
jgi:hypothetical protein